MIACKSDYNLHKVFWKLVPNSWRMREIVCTKKSVNNLLLVSNILTARSIYRSFVGASKGAEMFIDEMTTHAVAFWVDGKPFLKPQAHRGPGWTRSLPYLRRHTNEQTLALHTWLHPSNHNPTTKTCMPLRTTAYVAVDVVSSVRSYVQVDHDSVCV